MDQQCGYTDETIIVLGFVLKIRSGLTGRQKCNVYDPVLRIDGGALLTVGLDRAAGFAVAPVRRPPLDASSALSCESACK